jgi:DNA ligase (NAD+)
MAWFVVSDEYHHTMSDSHLLLQQTKSILVSLQDDNFPLWSYEQCDHIYRDLIDIIVWHNIAYYQYQKPIISDQQYDYLYDKLKSIESRFPELILPESPTQQLVWQVQDQFVKAEHLYPLLSLDNSYNTSDIQDWYDSVVRMLTKSDDLAHLSSDNFDVNFVCQPKYDGVAIELVYRDGILTQAITRGDGRIGEDVTANIMPLDTVPKQLPWWYPDLVSIRGEVVMPKSVFHNLNTQKINQWLISFVNTRNACSGSLKQLDPQVTAQRWLICYVYDILNYQDLSLHTQEQMYQSLTQWWFTLYPRYVVCTDISHVQHILNDPEIKKMLDEADIDFDGVVIKINQMNYCQSLWFTNHHPRRAIAYKFQARQVHTTLISVEYQVGRMGTITPVAILQPINLAGVTISKATLHNFDFITKKDIRIWDQVVIQRSGEVIPYVVSVVGSVRTGRELAIDPPVSCPACQTPVFHEDIMIFCPNLTCRAKIKQQILHFVSRNAMNIEWLGDSIVDMLLHSGIVKGRVDIYTLCDSHLRSTLKSLPLLWDKKLDQLIIQIQASKHRELWRIVHGIGIPHVGKKTAMMIADAVGEYVRQHAVPVVDVARIVHILLLPHFLTSIFGLGDKSVQAIRSYFTNQNHIANLMALQHAWVRFDGLPLQQDVSSVSQTSLTRKHIAISGTFALPRSQLIDIITWQGALYDEQLSRKTDLVIIGHKAWSKITKAQQRGITIAEGIDGLLHLYPHLKSQLAPYKEKPEVWLFV